MLAESLSHWQRLLWLARTAWLAAVATVFFAVCLPAARANDDACITIWNYYRHPPFYYSETQGLALDFVALMNSLAESEYRFALVNAPRKRIDQNLKFGERGAVLFVNWIWMDDKDRTRYLWSPPLLSDRNDILSNAAAPIEFDDLKSLYGKKLGGVPGRKYPGIDTAVAMGEIVRQDSPSTEQNLEKLLMGRIDFLTAPNSILRNLVREHRCEDKVHYSREPLTRYTRHIMMPRYMPREYAEVKRILERLLRSPQWKAIKRHYLVD